MVCSPRSTRPLEFVRGVLDLPLNESLLDCRHHAAHFVDSRKIGECFFFQFGGESLDAVGSPQGVHGIGDSRLERDRLLSAQGEGGGLLARQCEGLIQGVRVQGLGAAEDRGKSLEGRPNHVDMRLLGGQVGPCRLGMEAQLLRSAGSVLQSAPS